MKKDIDRSKNLRNKLCVRSKVSTCQLFPRSFICRKTNIFPRAGEGRRKHLRICTRR